MKIHTEKEAISLSQEYLFKLRNLYLENNEMFNYLQDYIPFAVYVKNENTHEYIYCNNNFMTAGKEMERLSKEGLEYLIKISDYKLLMRSTRETEIFFKSFDLNSICSYPQKILLNGKMTSYVTNKLIIDNKSSFCVSLYSKHFKGIEKLASELLPHENIDSEKFNRYQSLTKREKEIFSFIVEGYTNKQISDFTFTSIHTVRTHRNKIWKKLDINHFKDCLKYLPYLNKV